MTTSRPAEQIDPPDYDRLDLAARAWSVGSSLASFGADLAEAERESRAVCENVDAPLEIMARPERY